MAKQFAIDDDADVVLTVELPTENIDEEQNSKTRSTPCRYYAGNRHYLEVLNIAQSDPKRTGSA